MNERKRLYKDARWLASKAFMDIFKLNVFLNKGKLISWFGLCVNY